MEKCDRARQATDDNIIRRMRISCCITKDTDTHFRVARAPLNVTLYVHYLSFKLEFDFKHTYL